MANLPTPKNARDVGECIYCGGSQNLRKEHAVPYGLNGPWTLLRASCPDCERITSNFERDTLRCLLPAIRTVLEMQTRKPEKRRTNFPLQLEIKGQKKVVEVPLAEYPLYLPTPLLPPPGVILGSLPPTTSVAAKLGFLHIAGPSFEKVCLRYGADFVGARLNFSPHEFAQTLAKIAFCAAIFALGTAPLKYTPIRRVILGEDSCVEHWVGSWTGKLVNEAKGLHAMQIRASGSDIHVILRLFAQFGAPEYLVVLGPADSAFVNSDAWPWK